MAARIKGNGIKFHTRAKRVVAIAIECRQHEENGRVEKIVAVAVLTVAREGEGGWKTMLLRHVCNSLSQTSRVRAACPISYRQNALKMPQASRAVIIEETCTGRRDARRN